MGGRLLEGSASGRVRRDLHSAVGFLADLAGWGSVDAGYHEPVMRYSRAALHCAEQAGDWRLRANGLSDMARQAIYRSHLEDGLSLIELAQVQQDRAHADRAGDAVHRAGPVRWPRTTGRPTTLGAVELRNRLTTALVAV